MNENPQPPIFESVDARMQAGIMGMWLFIASLSTLFIASLVGYLVVRSQAQDWPPPDMPPLPNGLWWSTLVIILSSLTIHLSLKSTRAGKLLHTKIFLILTTFLGFLFIVIQLGNWMYLINLDMPATARNLYAFTFYMLTGLHGIHVFGGIVLLLIVTIKAANNTYTETYHPGILYSTMYWHFLDIVWIVIFICLMVAI